MKTRKMIRQERRVCNPNNVCVRCGNQLRKNDIHHFVCNDCWVPGIMYSQEIREKLKGVDLREWKE